MRAFPLLLIASAGACSTPQVNAPSLAPRAAEAIDPRAPVPEPPISTTPSAGLVGQLDRLVAEAQSGDAAFKPAIDKALRLAAEAGPVQSESWILAQQALSVALSARSPVTHASAEIDSIRAEQVRRLGGIGAADMNAIDSAAARVHEIDQGEAAAVDRVQALLER
jgi:hypothetical protein